MFIPRIRIGMLLHRSRFPAIMAMHETTPLQLSDSPSKKHILQWRWRLRDRRTTLYCRALLFYLTRYSS